MESSTDSIYSLECSSPLSKVDYSTLRTEKPETIDIEFLFPDPDTGEERKLGAHKLLLALSTPVFETQFFKRFDDAKDSTVTILDSSYQSFKYFLDHIYCDTVPWSQLSLSTLYELHSLADKYQLHDLAEYICNRVSGTSVTVHNILEAATVAENISFIDAEDFTESLHSATANIAYDDFINIFFTDFENEDVEFLHSFLGKVAMTNEFINITQETSLEYVNNLMKTKRELTVSFQHFLNITADSSHKDRFPVVRLFSKCPANATNSSQLFRIFKMNFESFEVSLEQMDGSQVSLRLRAWDTIEAVLAKVRMADLGLAKGDQIEVVYTDTVHGGEAGASSQHSC